LGKQEPEHLGVERLSVFGKAIDHVIRRVSPFCV